MVTLQETSKCWHCNFAVNGLLVIEDVSSGWETSSWVPASVTGWRMVARSGFSGHLIYRTCSEWSLLQFRSAWHSSSAFSLLMSLRWGEIHLMINTKFFYIWKRKRSWIAVCFTGSEVRAVIVILYFHVKFKLFSHF